LGVNRLGQDFWSPLNQKIEEDTGKKAKIKRQKLWDKEAKLGFFRNRVAFQIISKFWILLKHFIRLR